MFACCVIRAALEARARSSLIMLPAMETRGWIRKVSRQLSAFSHRRTVYTRAKNFFFWRGRAFGVHAIALSCACVERRVSLSSLLHSIQQRAHAGALTFRARNW